MQGEGQPQEEIAHPSRTCKCTVQSESKQCCSPSWLFFSVCLCVCMHGFVNSILIESPLLKLRFYNCLSLPFVSFCTLFCCLHSLHIFAHFVGMFMLVFLIFLVLIFTCVQDFQSLKRQHGMGEMRKVTLNKGPEEGLGMSITVREACFFITSSTLFFWPLASPPVSSLFFLLSCKKAHFYF